MLTLVITMMLLTVADSLMPRMSRADSAPRMMIAGMLMIPCTPSGDTSSGE